MREQIIAQVSLGIVSGDLQAGEKLPSTREIARRFQIHQNTVSAAYRELAERNLVEFKKGRGVYVRENPAVEVGANSPENLTSRFFQEAAAHGFSDGEIKAHLQQRLTAKPATNFLVVESDAELRKILMAEIPDVISRNVAGISFEQAARNHASGDAKVWLMFDKAENSRCIPPPDAACIRLKANSVPDSMIGKARPSKNDLIAVVSGWESFLTLAKMFLLAARVAPETLVLRSPNQSDWKNGLESASLIICDSATAKEFPDDERTRVFRLIADSSLDSLLESIE